MGAPPFELQGRPRDKPITANARTKTANARPLNPFASNKRMAARASHTSSPFPRHLRNAQTVSRVPDLLGLKAPTENPARANLKDPPKDGRLRNRCSKLCKRVLCMAFSNRQLRLGLYSANLCIAEKNTSRNGILQPPPEKRGTASRSPALFRRET